MRKTGSERLSNLPKDTQRAGERMRTRAQTYSTPSHFRMASRLLSFRNTGLVWKETRSLKCAGRKFQGCLGEKLRWAVLNRLLFHPASGSTASCRAPSSLCSPWPSSQPAQPTLTMMPVSWPQFFEEKGSNTSLSGFVNYCWKGNRPLKM